MSWWRNHSILVVCAIVAAIPGVVHAASVAPTLKIGYNAFDRTALTASSALVVDAETGEMLFSHEPGIPHPAASLTKLMSAIIFLEQKPNWGKRVAMSADDEVGGGRLQLKPGSIVTTRDLFYSSLVGSANNAATALMRISGLAKDAFIREMNIRAATLAMSRTRFVDPSGIDSRNTTTAEDIAKLARYAFQNLTIKRATTTGEYRFSVISPRIAKKIKNTNRLLVVDPDIYITGGKTGYLDESKYNLVIRARDANRHQVIVVTLGSEKRDASFNEAKALAHWTFANYEWK